jgi:hypothetical protein
MKRLGLPLLLLSLGVRIAGAQSAPPRIADIVPEHAAGIGQLITVQGFNLSVLGPSMLTLTPVFGGSPTTCVSVLPPAPSSPNELYVRLAVFQSPNPAGCSKSIPSVIGPELYRVTVTTPGGTSNAVLLAVFKPPATPIPRRLLKCSTSPCSPNTTFMPGDLLGILARAGREEGSRCYGAGEPPRLWLLDVESGRKTDLVNDPEHSLLEAAFSPEAGGPGWIALVAEGTGPGATRGFVAPFRDGSLPNPRE